ncbi:T9SS type A sorting domain-containing protein [Flavilitoribacter nigricans]|uniref:T9SS type A sorting domain-containing protein n=1 Tax=Flavilitoribacter nigricans TaxID=70997 RepID=UPI0014760DB7|nr:T9SS type A sorting domain-containing protein [Flavilitoribacter nigricans]
MSGLKNLLFTCLFLLPVFLQAQITIEFEITNPKCYDYTDGSVLTTISGGAAPYTVAWSNGSTVKDLYGVGAGEYVISVTDSNGAEAVDTATVTEPGPVEASAAITSDFCSLPAEITATPGGGVEPYMYEWTDGSTEQTFTAMEPGQYCVTISDANWCAAVACVIVPEPLELELVVLPPACPLGCDGSVTAIVTGGKSPYTYQWSNGATTSINPNLLPGVFTVTVTDANGCTIEGTATVEDGTSSLDVTITASNPDCKGTGSLTASAIGGQEPYLYVWNTGQTGPTLNNLDGGTYTVTVTDANGCKVVETKELIGDSDLDVAAELIDYECGDTIGAITVVALAGVPPYTFTWNNGQTEATATGLTPGEVYTVTVTDETGCTVSRTFPVVDPDGLEFDVIVTNPDCSGFNSGKATVMIPGDADEYNITWSNGSMQDTVGLLGPGDYSVTVYDNQGCGGIADFTIVAPEPLEVSAEVTDALCGEAIGTATAMVTGGTPPYMIKWSDNQMGAMATGLLAGTYTVLVTDANDCEVMALVTIDESEGITCEVTEVSAVSESGAMDGEASVSVDGGSEPYTYEWSDGQTTATATGLAAGSYSVTVTDANGCSTTCSIELEADLICVNFTDGGEIAYDGGPLCGPGVDPEEIVSVSLPTGGSGEIEYLWMKSTKDGPFRVDTYEPIPDSNSPSYDPGPLQQTTYFARCARRGGCPSFVESNIVKIEVGDDAVAKITPPDYVCSGQSVVFMAEDNGPGATYSWDFGLTSNPRTSTEINPVVTYTNFGNRTVTLEVTANGCTSTTSVRVSILNGGPNCSTANAMAIYPNPFQQSFFIEQIEGNKDQPVKISLETFYGQQLQTYDWKDQTIKHEIIARDLPAGVYMARIKVGDGNEKTYMVVKQKN